MANQRIRLKQFYGRAPLSYVAFFDHISHKTDAKGRRIPVALIKNIILVDPFGRFLAPTGFMDFEVVGKPYMVADHTWVTFTKQWFKLPEEVLPGDRIYFNAKIEKYRINRSDVQEKRNEIWQETLKTNDFLSKRWHDKAKNNPGINYKVSFQKLKEQRKENLENAKVLQHQIELVDYSFSHLRDVRLVTKNKATSNIKRIKYDYSQYIKTGYQYSFWLATRTQKILDKLKKGNN